MSLFRMHVPLMHVPRLYICPDQGIKNTLAKSTHNTLRSHVCYKVNEDVCFSVTIFKPVLFSWIYMVLQSCKKIISTVWWGQLKTRWYMQGDCGAGGLEVGRKIWYQKNTHPYLPYNSLTNKYYDIELLNNPYSKRSVR